MEKCWRLFSFLVIDRTRGQEYLDRMATQGWELERVYLGLLARFRRTERTDLTYFWDWTDPVKAEDPEYIRLCADAGWELVETVPYGNLYASRPGTSPLPIQTDPELEYQRFRRKVLRRMGIGILGVLLVVAFYWVSMGLIAGSSVPFSVFAEPSFLAYLLTGSLLLPLLLLCLPFLLLGGAAYFLLLVRRLWVWKRAIGQGQDLPPLVPWAGRLWGGLRAAGHLSLGLFFLLLPIDALVNGVVNWGVGLGLILGGVLRFWLDEGKPRQQDYSKLVCILGAAMILGGLLNGPFRTVFPGRLPAAPLTAAGEVQPVPRERRADSFFGSYARWEEEFPGGELAVEIHRWTLSAPADWYLPRATAGMEPVAEGVWSDGWNYLIRQSRTFVHMHIFPTEAELPTEDILRWIETAEK